MTWEPRNENPEASLPDCRQVLKFGLSEKHTKFEKNLPDGFDKSSDLLSECLNH